MPVTIHNHLIDKLAVIVGIFSGFALYPQIYAIILSGTDEGVSLTTFGLIFVNSIVWLLYAMHRGLVSLAIPSVLNILGSGTVLYFVLTV